MTNLWERPNWFCYNQIEISWEWAPWLTLCQRFASVILCKVRLGGKQAMNSDPTRPHSNSLLTSTWQWLHHLVFCCYFVVIVIVINRPMAKLLSRCHWAEIWWCCESYCGLWPRSNFSQQQTQIHCTVWLQLHNGLWYFCPNLPKVPNVGIQKRYFWWNEITEPHSQNSVCLLLNY